MIDTPPSPPPEKTASPAEWAFCFASTKDVDEQAERLKGWNQIYAQTSAGPFAGLITQVSFAGLHLFSESTSRPLFQLGALDPHDLAVGVPLQSDGRGVFCGSPCNADALHVFSGAEGFEFHSPGGLVMGGLVIRRDELLTMVSTTEQELLRQAFASAHLRNVGTHHAEAARELIRSVLEVFRASPCLVKNQAVRDALKSALISNVAEILIGEGGPREPLPPKSKSWDIVAAAHQHVLDNPDRPVSIGELCRTLGISRRTLQYCFHDHLGESPASFLRNVRLNGVRRAMRSAPSVTDAATMWGFWHFGRFAHDYKAMFGELPSDAHRRRHRARAS